MSPAWVTSLYAQAQALENNTDSIYLTIRASQRYIEPSLRHAGVTF